MTDRIVTKSGSRPPHAAVLAEITGGWGPFPNRWSRLRAYFHGIMPGEHARKRFDLVGLSAPTACSYQPHPIVGVVC